MSDFHYDAARTGLLLVDPYNDFLSEGGKLWRMVKEVAGVLPWVNYTTENYIATTALEATDKNLPRRSFRPIEGGSRGSSTGCSGNQESDCGNWEKEWSASKILASSTTN